MSKSGTSELRKALERGLANNNLGEELRKFTGDTFSSLTDAKDISWALKQLGTQPSLILAEQIYAVAGLFQNVDGRECEAFAHLQEFGIPELIRLYDLTSDSSDQGAVRRKLFILKILALYATEEGTNKVIDAAKLPVEPGAFQWTIIFDCFTSNHPFASKLFQALSNPFPRGFISVALLDAANSIAREESEFNHPFNSDEGKKRLRVWLRTTNLDQYSFAHSAAAALPFISEPERSEFLQLAMDHPDMGVSMEAAWAAAKIGQERGIVHLSRYAKDVRTAKLAYRYLEELGRTDAIPPEAELPDFQAMAEMVSWLSHPNEFGQAPDTIELYDTRDLYWPPTEDRRKVWLFRYCYAANDLRDTPETGLGMVGSITFSLFDEATADLSPVDAYALHCCWELETKGDLRAPQERSIERGRQILSEYNQLEI